MKRVQSKTKKTTIKFPTCGKKVFVDPSAQVIGDVEIGDFSSVWPGAVLRGDINSITIGRYSNIQDQSVIHVESDTPTEIGDFVVVGHQVILHACTVGNQCLIGMGSIIMDGVSIGDGTIIGAGSLVTQGEKLKPGCLYFGRPAQFVRKLTSKEIAGLKNWARRYAKYAEDHLNGKFGRILPVSDDVRMIMRQTASPGS